jgi:hypothetical protein
VAKKTSFSTTYLINKVTIVSIGIIFPINVESALFFF